MGKNPMPVIPELKPEAASVNFPQEYECKLGRGVINKNLLSLRAQSQAKDLILSL